MLRTAATISKLSFTNFHSLINQYHYSAQQTLSILKMRINQNLSYRLESIQCLILQNTIGVLQYARKTIHATYLAASENAKGTRFRKSSKTCIHLQCAPFVHKSLLFVHVETCISQPLYCSLSLENHSQKLVRCTPSYLLHSHIYYRTTLIEKNLHTQIII